MSCFTGYVIREEKDNTKRKEDSDFESDSDDDDFEGADQDFEFPRKPSRKLRNVVENMKQMELKNGRFVAKPGITRVRGRFDRLFSQPWWMVDLKIKAAQSSRNEKRASSLPSYSSRTDADAGEDVLSLFLIKGCEVDSHHVALLLEFIRRSNLRPTLKDLMENLEKFADSSEDGHCTVARQIQTCLRCSRKFGGRVTLYIRANFDLNSEGADQKMEKTALPPPTKKINRTGTLGLLSSHPKFSEIFVRNQMERSVSFQSNQNIWDHLEVVHFDQSNWSDRNLVFHFEKLVSCLTSVELILTDAGYWRQECEMERTILLRVKVKNWFQKWVYGKPE